MMKECAEEMAPKLQKLFRRLIDEGEVPKQWKEAHIVPIHKGRSKAIMSNFRLVALTSAVCKVLERLICASQEMSSLRHSSMGLCGDGHVKPTSCYA